MSQEIVAGFEEQQVAHELSAQVVEEALQAIIGRLTMGSPEPTAEADRTDDANKDGARDETEDDSRSGGPEVEASLDGSLAASSSGLDDDTDEHCGRQASQINLRQLRLSALEDMLVCDQRRHNTKAARHLFNRLANQTAAGQDERAKQAYCGVGRRHAAANQMGSSMSSRSGDNNSDDDNHSAGSNRLDIDSLDELLGGCQADEANDCGTIKLERRCCSSSSSSSVNFGRTLVCSVSPTGQFNLNATNTNNNNHHKALNIHELGNGQANQERNDDDLNYYPINGDEIRQCRAAFRENRRLIEQAQSEAVGRHLAAGASLSRSASQATMRPDRVGQDRSRWADSLGRRSRLPDCSRCQQKLYPVDKMDLDFTRATLNIHRNCFKCQVCATLLRLETYASIDTKLYCPAHVKCVAPSR